LALGSCLLALGTWLLALGSVILNLCKDKKIKSLEIIFLKKDMNIKCLVNLGMHQFENLKME
jgi:hypothetical protein